MMMGQDEDCEAGEDEDVEPLVGSDNDDDHDDDDDDGAEVIEGVMWRPQQGLQTLQTLGEPCIHLICEFLRLFRPADPPLGGRFIGSSHKDLSHLSMTCRTLYIAVRNLRPVAELVAPLTTVCSPHPWSSFADVAYWSHLTGVFWRIASERELAALAHDKAITPAILRKMYVAVSDTRSQVALVEDDGPDNDDEGEVGKRTVAQGSTEACLRKDLEFVVRNLGGLRIGPREVPHNIRLSWCTHMDYLAIAPQQAHVSKVPHLHLMGTFNTAALDPLLDGVTNLSVHTAEGVTTLSPFANLRALEFYFAPSLSAICGLSGMVQLRLLGSSSLTVVSDLSSIRTLDLAGHSRLETMTRVKTVHRLLLNYSVSLISLDDLAHIGTLKASNCTQLASVTKVCNVHTLDLSYDRRLTAISQVSNIHCLVLSGCHSLTSLAGVSNVHTAHLSHCTLVTDVAALAGAHRVDLSHCTHLEDVSALGSVHTLFLAYCERMTDVSSLGAVHELSLAYCRSVTDFRALTDVHTLNLSGCSNLTDVSPFRSSHTLNLSFCSALEDVSALSGVHKLDLTLCSALVDVSALGYVHTLVLYGCYSIVDVSGLTNNHSVDLRSCSPAVRAQALLLKITRDDSENIWT